MSLKKIGIVAGALVIGIGGGLFLWQYLTPPPRTEIVDAALAEPREVLLDTFVLALTGEQAEVPRAAISVWVTVAMVSEQDHVTHALPRLRQTVFLTLTDATRRGVVPPPVQLTTLLAGALTADLPASVASTVRVHRLAPGEEAPVPATKAEPATASSGGH
ncbi:MAG: hypothetical protein RIE31_01620 [Alphaproteobacteria bacterium]